MTYCWQTDPYDERSTVCVYSGVFVHMHVCVCAFLHGGADISFCTFCHCQPTSWEDDKTICSSPCSHYPPTPSQLLEISLTADMSQQNVNPFMRGYYRTWHHRREEVRDQGIPIISSCINIKHLPAAWGPWCRDTLDTSVYTRLNMEMKWRQIWMAKKQNLVVLTPICKNICPLWTF